MTTRPFCSTVKKQPPITAPTMDTLPPLSAVPPNTGPAKDNSIQSPPIEICAEFSCAASKMPAAAPSRPLKL